MGWNDHVDWELSALIDDLVDEGLLDTETAGYGVCQQVITSGFDSLTASQQQVFDRHVAPLLEKRGRQLEVQRIIDSNPE